MSEPIAVYVHVPFCPSKCGYCDFNSYAMAGEIMPRTVDAMIEEVRRSPAAGRPAKTVFFGGGTPTFLSENDLLRLFEEVLRQHPPLPGAEITSEANPGTVDMPKFAAMRGAGFNRISLGAQSFSEGDLITLGRVHRSGEIDRAVGAARQAGFGSLNLDLMFGLPNQRMAGWITNMERALALEPDHLSLYCLTIEQNTAFYKMNLRGLLSLPDEDSQVEMYEACLDRMTASGFAQYEISNFAKPGFECRHNLAYWLGEEYVGYGPGAVGAFIRPDSGLRVRYTNIKHPIGYSEAVENCRTIEFESEILDERAMRIESIMMGLRLNEGMPDAGLSPAVLNDLTSRGWVERRRDSIALTRKGRHFCSEAALLLI
jgi:oxygen-independent coproporphyrinogen-3 oxidase